MEIVKSFFARKKIGFYIGAATAILTLITSIVYIAGFSSSGSDVGAYYSTWVFVLTLFAFLSFVGLSLFKQTSNLAAPVMGFLSFIAFIVYAISGYMYFTEVFYGSFNFAGLANMNSAYIFCLFSLLVLLILNSVCVYLKQEKEPKEPKAQNELKEQDERKDETTTSEVNV